MLRISLVFKEKFLKERPYMRCKIDLKQLKEGSVEVKVGHNMSGYRATEAAY